MPSVAPSGGTRDTLRVISPPDPPCEDLREPLTSMLDTFRLSSCDVLRGILLTISKNPSRAPISVNVYLSVLHDQEIHAFLIVSKTTEHVPKSLRIEASIHLISFSLWLVTFLAMMTVTRHLTIS